MPFLSFPYAVPLPPHSASYNAALTTIQLIKVKTLGIWVERKRELGEILFGFYWLGKLNMFR